MTDPIVEAVDVVKLLGKGAAQVQALKGVSLALKRGELTLLMGPSGSGKTTLLSILGCILTPTRGMVRMGGRSTEGAGAEELAKLRREHVGFIFQSYHLFPTLTAADNVRLALDVRGDNSAHAMAKPTTPWPWSGSRTRRMHFHSSSAAANNSGSPSHGPSWDNHRPFSRTNPRLPSTARTAMRS